MSTKRGNFTRKDIIGIQANTPRRIGSKVAPSSKDKNKVVQKATIMAAIERNSVVIATISMRGKECKKSFSWYLDVRMDKSIKIEVEDENIPMPSDMANTLKNGSFNKSGTPTLLSTPPGTVKAAVNTTVAISVATTKHELEVLFIHFSPSFIRPLCVSLNMSCGVLPSLFFITL